MGKVGMPPSTLPNSYHCDLPNEIIGNCLDNFITYILFPQIDKYFTHNPFLKAQSRAY